MSKKYFKRCKFPWPKVSFLPYFRNLAKTIERELWLSKKEEVYFYAPISIYYIAATQTDGVMNTEPRGSLHHNAPFLLDECISKRLRDDFKKFSVPFTDL